ncbi:hypothetical protein GCM10027059_01830 [Myceligenerans halotolerans]
MNAPKPSQEAAVFLAEALARHASQDVLADAAWLMEQLAAIDVADLHRRAILAPHSRAQAIYTAALTQRVHAAHMAAFLNHTLTRARRTHDEETDR